MLFKVLVHKASLYGLALCFMGTLELAFWMEKRNEKNSIYNSIWPDDCQRTCA